MIFRLNIHIGTAGKLGIKCGNGNKKKFGRGKAECGIENIEKGSAPMGRCLHKSIRCNLQLTYADLVCIFHRVFEWN